MSKHFFHRSPNIITGGTLPAATQGTAYTTPFQGANGISPYSWAVTAASPNAGGQVPIGALTGNSLAFTPTNATTESITVQITDALGNTRTKVFTLTIRPTAVTRKITPGHYMASDTFDGTGGSENAADFSALAPATKVKGWLGLYSWGTVTAVQGVYDFSKQFADINAQQAAAPGTHGAIYLAAQRFHGSQPSSQNITSSWIPAYILSGSGYGAGTNGTQHGYTLASYAGSTGYTETAAALWRPAVMTEYANACVALLTTPFLRTAGPNAGQTMTLDEDPLFETLVFGYESALNLTNISTDYSDSAWRTQLASLYATVRAAAPGTLLLSGLNFCSSFANMAGFVSDLVMNSIGMGGPDIISAPNESWGQHLLAGDTSTNGTTWTTGGGKDYIGIVPSLQWMQDPDPAKAPNTQTIYNTAIALGATHIFWARLSRGNGVKGDWVTDVLPVINANPNTSPIMPSSWAGINFATPAMLPVGANGGLYLEQLSVTGNNGAVGYKLNSNSGSTLVGVTPEGLINAAPTVNETCSLSITATDAAGNPVTKTFTLVFNAVFAVTNFTQLPAGTQNAKYKFVLVPVGVPSAAAAGGSVTYNPSAPINKYSGLPTWVATGLPTGLTLGTDSAGNIAVTGTPTASPGTYNVSITATDQHSAQDVMTLTMVILAPDTASRPAGNTGTGFYVAANGKIYDPTGHRFIPRGTNRTHWDGYSSGPPSGPANIWRVFLDFTQPAANNVSLLQSIHVNHNQVVIPTNDNGTSGSSSVAVLNAAVASWVAQEPQFIALDNVMFINLANEWGPSNSTVWRDSNISAIASLRAAGYKALILIDSGGFGQDMGDLLNYAAAVLASDPQKNVAFGFHLYGNTSAAQVPTFLAELAALASSGICVLVSEWGPLDVGPSQTQVTPGTVITLCEQNNLPWLNWAWDDGPGSGGTDGGFNMCFNGPGEYFKPSDLTRYGRTVSYAQAYGHAALATLASSFL